jgi:hypothetical protein
MGRKKKQEQKPKMLFSIIYQVPFEPDPDLYDTKDPKEMAAMDEEAAVFSPLEAITAMATLPGGKWKVKVSHVESVAEKTGLKVKG